MPDFRFRGNSIRWRAALLTSMLVALVLTAFISVAVIRVKADLLQSGADRAETATAVLAAQSAQSTQQGVTRLNEIARDAALRACLQSPTEETKRAVKDRLGRGVTGTDQIFELWDMRGHLVVDAAFPPETEGLLPPNEPPAAAGLMPLQRRGDVAYTRVVADVPGDPALGQPAHMGYLITSRVIRAQTSTASVVNGIVGNGATVLIGNQSGSLWTDLAGIVPMPAIDLSRKGSREFRGADGEARIGAPAGIPGTPWLVLVSFPRSVIVAPAWQLLRQLIIAGLFIMLAAMLAAGLLSGQVTKPLGDLTLAARAIEQGNYASRVVAHRYDEVGKLGRAFNAMAGQIESGRAALEAHAVELAASREAERHTNQVKDEFLAVLSHELRTPLNAMLGWCQMLREGAVPPESTKRALTVIERNAIAQLRLVEDLLDVSRIVAGKFVLEMQLVDPATVVHAAIESIQPMATAKDIHVAATIEPGAGAGGGFVHGDSGRLQQAVWNLLSNAIKFTPRGGAVSVTVRHVGSSVEIVVGDNGEGISEDQLPLIFERLQQGDGGAARRHAGLGLGLAIVRQVIGLHHGSVCAESEGLGQGATFRIVLPIAKVPVLGVGQIKRPPLVISGSLADAGAPSVRGVRILVVEDVDDARDLLTDLLTGQGAVVTALPSAEQAVMWLRRNRPDIIVSDIEMPGQDGFEMMRLIRSQQAGPGEFIPAIALTAYAAPEDRDRSLASGFQVHLIKPVNLTELLVTVASLVPRHHHGPTLECRSASETRV